MLPYDIYNELYDSDHFRTPEFYSLKDQLQISIEQGDIHYVQHLFNTYPELFLKKNNGIIFNLIDVLILFGQLWLEDKTDQKLKQYLINFISEGKIKEEIKNITSFLSFLMNKDLSYHSYILTQLWRSQPKVDIQTKMKILEFSELAFEKKADLFKKDCIFFINQILNKLESAKNELLTIPVKIFLRQLETKNDKEMLSNLGKIYLNEKIKTVEDLHLVINLIEKGCEATIEQQFNLLDFAMQQKPIDNDICSFLTKRVPLIFKDDKNNEKINIYQLKQSLSEGNELYFIITKSLKKLKKHKECKNMLEILPYSLSIKQLLDNNKKALQKLNSALENKKKSYFYEIPLLLKEVLTYFKFIHTRLFDFVSNPHNIKRQEEIKYLLKSDDGLKALGFSGVNLVEKNELSSFIYMIETIMQKLYPPNSLLFFKSIQSTPKEKSIAILGGLSLTKN
jgi:hypothetical protein